MADPRDLPKLQRDRLRAQADMFAAVAEHGTIIGSAREAALLEFFRGLVPRRYEVLSGAIATEESGRLEKASNQLDVMVVDTLDYPTLLRTGDLAIVLPHSVLVVVESKSNLSKGEEFFDAMTQIGQAKLVAGLGTLTALFCFGAPQGSNTLRRWLQGLLRKRKRLLRAARKEQETAKRQKLASAASLYSASNLPDVILSDGGAIAMRKDDAAKGTSYEFYKGADGAPAIVALASKVMAQVSRQQQVPSANASASFKILVNHFEAGFEPSGDEALDVTDEQPKP